MKRSDYIAVGALLKELFELEKCIRATGAENCSVEVDILVQGRTIQSTIRNLCLPVLEDYYRAEIAKIWDRLEDLGVEA